MAKYIILLVILVTACCPEEEMGKDLTGITYSPTAWSVGLPDGWPALVVPADNPMTEEGIDLGRHLFYDNVLSTDNTQSCATCHQPVGAFTDNLPVSTGIDGIAGLRSSMSLVNIGLVQPVQGSDQGFLFWDGRSKSLEEQALLPVEDPIELHNEWTTVIKELQDMPLYHEKFRQAFGITNTTEITKELAAKAIAQFERSLLSYNSTFDRERRGEITFSEDELDGFLRYIDDNDIPIKHQFECSHCHTLPLTTSDQFANNALQPAETLQDFVDMGRGVVTGQVNENGMFRIPTLRNIMHSAPYMHNGSLATIDDVIEHYFTGGHFSPNADPTMRDASVPGKKDFDEDDRRVLKAFLETFTDTTFLNNPAFSDPFN